MGSPSIPPSGREVCQRADRACVRLGGTSHRCAAEYREPGSLRVAGGGGWRRHDCGLYAHAKRRGAHRDDVASPSTASCRSVPQRGAPEMDWISVCVCARLCQFMDDHTQVHSAPCWQTCLPTVLTGSSRALTTLLQCPTHTEGLSLVGPCSPCHRPLGAC